MKYDFPSTAPRPPQYITNLHLCPLQAEELLRTAVEGNTASNSKILDFITQVRAERTGSRLNSAQQPKPVPRRKAEPYPGAVPLLESLPRPLSALSGGRRRVPIMANTSIAPFLRIKKPQPPFLSRVLRYKVTQRQRQNDNLDEL